MMETLEWETFEFADSPKRDKRFDDNKQGNHVAASTKECEDIEARETVEDWKVQERFAWQHQAWLTIDAKIIEKVTHVLLPFVMPDRWERIQSVLQQRMTQNALFCFKVLPILPMSGHVHEYHWIVQEFNMSMSSLAKWLTVINHFTSSHALEAAVREEYHIVCTDVNPDSKDIREVNWEASGKNCLSSWAVNNTELAMKARPRLASTDVRLSLSFGNMELNFQRI